MLAQLSVMKRKDLIPYIIIIILISIIFFLIGIIFSMKKQEVNTNKNTEGKNTNKYVEDEKNVTHNTQTNQLITSNSNNTTNTNENYENINSQNKSIENVKIQIKENTISPYGLTIIITDNNKEHYGWGENYAIQEKVNGEWKKLNVTIDFNSNAYILDSNNQLTQNINWENSYGKLPKGIYRIEKEADGDLFYSNEFEIK